MARRNSGNASTASGPGVLFPPPMLFVVCSLAGHLVERQLPSPWQAEFPAIFPMGFLLMALAGAWLTWALVKFRLARTPIYPNQRASRMITDGPYRFSRNPMYVACAGLQTGLGILASNLWILLLVPFAFFLSYVLIVRHEERYLKSEFGDEYRAYCASVRRWI